MSATSTKLTTKKAVETRPLRFAGVSLAGGKTHKTAVSILEYYPRQQRLFVRSIYSELGSHLEGESADMSLYRLLTQEERPLKYVAFDAPLKFPKCVRCELPCPGYEKCKEPEIKWMWQFYKKAEERKKKPLKIFTPYTERCADVFLASEMGDMFHTNHALGANRAPLAARAHFLSRRMRRLRILEYYPRLTLWQIGKRLGVQKSYLKFYKHSNDSEAGRNFFLNQLVKQGWLFLYQQDQRLATEDPAVFDSILGGVTGYLKFRGQTAAPPIGFPPEEPWVEYPRVDFDWFPETGKRSRL